MRKRTRGKENKYAENLKIIKEEVGMEGRRHRKRKCSRNRMPIACVIVIDILWQHRDPAASSMMMILILMKAAVVVVVRRRRRRENAVSCFLKPQFPWLYYFNCHIFIVQTNPNTISFVLFLCLPLRNFLNQKKKRKRKEKERKIYLREKENMKRRSQTGKLNENWGDGEIEEVVLGWG